MRVKVINFPITGRLKENECVKCSKCPALILRALVSIATGTKIRANGFRYFTDFWRGGVWTAPKSKEKMICPNCKAPFCGIELKSNLNFRAQEATTITSIEPGEFL